MSSPEVIGHVAVRTARVSEKTEWTFVTVECSDGVVGVGEASMNGMSSALRGFAPFLNDRMKGLAALPNVASRALSDTRGGQVQRALASASEQALWDAQGKRLGLPVCDLLGGALRKSIPLYANINRATTVRTPEGFADTARRAWEEGFRFVKLAPFDGLDGSDPLSSDRLFRVGIERLAAVCQEVGDKAAVMIDCHWRLTENLAMRLLEQAAELGLFWVECPIPEVKQQLPALRRLRQKASNLGVRLAGMEKGADFQSFQPYIDEQLYDVLMPDVKYVGGLTETQQVAAAAGKAGQLIAPHNPTGPVCHAASVQVSATLPNLLFLEFQFRESPLFEELVGHAGPVDKGSAPVSRAPGLGVTLMEDVLSQVEVVSPV